jgi:hypothetical protein
MMGCCWWWPNNDIFCCCCGIRVRKRERVYIMEWKCNDYWRRQPDVVVHEPVLGRWSFDRFLTNVTSSSQCYSSNVFLTSWKNIVIVVVYYSDLYNFVYTHTPLFDRQRVLCMCVSSHLYKQEMKYRERTSQSESNRISRCLLV